MKLILYLLIALAMLSATGCVIFPDEGERRGGGEHWEHHDRDWDHDGYSGDHR